MITTEQKRSFLGAAILSAIFSAQVQAQQPSGTSGQVNHDRWWNMGAARTTDSILNNNKFYQPSNTFQLLSEARSPRKSGKKFAQRLRGYIVAPVTGEYLFAISANDHSALWLSSDDDKFNKTKIIDLRRHTARDSFIESRQQWSSPVSLLAGQRYYLEAIAKEKNGDDHLTVAYTYTSGSGLTNLTQQPGVTASMSTQSIGRIAEKAIDGNRSGRYIDASIAETLEESGARIEIDLGAEKAIDRVDLYNADEDSNFYARRLSNFRITLLDQSGSTVSSQDFYTTPATVMADPFNGVGGASDDPFSTSLNATDNPFGSSFTLNPNNSIDNGLMLSEPSGHARARVSMELSNLTARYVQIELLGANPDGSNVLALAEVEVFGRSNPADHYQPLQIIAASDLESYNGHLNDTDDDSYPDTWEVANGFDPTTADTGNHAPNADPDGDGVSNIAEAYAGTSPFVADELAGKVITEHWYNIPFPSVNELYKTDDFFEAADEAYLVDNVRRTGLKRFSGSRMRGYITAPETGDYVFWATGRRSVEFWLSTDVTKFQKVKLAGLSSDEGNGSAVSADSVNLWDNYSNQMSQQVHLVAGQKYFFEVVQQNDKIINAHTGIAWARPGQDRELLPMTFVSSFPGDANDLDDDYLPDAWETAHGLNPTDNGGFDRNREGERGDFDSDGLFNREEFVLGTDPANPDSDGDGTSDGEEVNSYGTNPKVSDATGDLLVSTIGLNTYSSSSGWTETSQGLIPESFRGDISWDFSVPSSGHWILHLDTKLFGKLYLNEAIEVEALIDGVSVLRKELLYSASHEALLRILTPELAAGTHTVTLRVHNLVARRTVAITNVELRQPQGPDANADGTPDWVETQISSDNNLLTQLATSRTSPAFLEGTTRSLITVNGAPAEMGIDQSHWFYNLPLAAATSTPYTIDYAMGTSEAGNIAWEASNVIDQESLVIRKDDSLKLTAQPLDGLTGQPVTIHIDGSAIAIQEALFDFNTEPAGTAIEDALNTGSNPLIQLPPASSSSGSYSFLTDGAGNAIVTGNAAGADVESIIPLPSPVTSGEVYLKYSLAGHDLSNHQGIFTMGFISNNDRHITMRMSSVDLSAGVGFVLTHSGGDYGTFFTEAPTTTSTQDASIILGLNLDTKRLNTYLDLTGDGQYYPLHVDEPIINSSNWNSVKSIRMRVSELGEGDSVTLDQVCLAHSLAGILDGAAVYQDMPDILYTYSAREGLSTVANNNLGTTSRAGHPSLSLTAGNTISYSGAGYATFTTSGGNATDLANLWKGYNTGNLSLRFDLAGHDMAPSSTEKTFGFALRDSSAKGLLLFQISKPANEEAMRLSLRETGGGANQTTNIPLPNYFNYDTTGASFIVSLDLDADTITVLADVGHTGTYQELLTAQPMNKPSAFNSFNQYRTSINAALANTSDTFQLAHLAVGSSLASVIGTTTTIYPTDNLSGDAVYNLPSDADFVTHQFIRAGDYTVISTDSLGNNHRANITVKGARFPTTRDLVSNDLTTVRYNATEVDPSLTLETGSRLEMRNGPSLVDGELQIDLAPKESGPTRLLARLYPGGPIVSYHDFNIIEFTDAIQNDVSSSFPSGEYPGYFVITTPVAVSDLPPGGSLKVIIFRSGVTFTDGSTTKTLSADDFNNGIYTLEFLFPIGMQGAYCHYIDVYDRYGNKIGRR